MVLPDGRSMPPSEVKLLNFSAHLINSSRSSPRLALPCLPDWNSDLMLAPRWPKIYASGLFVCDNLWTAFSVTLGPRLLMPCFMQSFLCQVSWLKGMLVPFLQLLVALWFHPACFLSPCLKTSWDRLILLDLMLTSTPLTAKCEPGFSGCRHLSENNNSSGLLDLNCCIPNSNSPHRHDMTLIFRDLSFITPSLTNF